MKKIWAFLVAVGAVIAAAAVAAALKARRAARNVQVDAATRAERKAIEELQAKITVLSADAAANDQQIKHASEQIVAKKEQLNATFQRQGLTADEIADRFRRLRIIQ